MPKKPPRSRRKKKDLAQSNEGEKLKLPSDLIATKTKAADLEEKDPQRAKRQFPFRNRSFLLRIAIVAFPAIGIVYIIHVAFGPFASGAAFTALGILGSWIVSKIEESKVISGGLVTPWTPESWLGIAFLSIILFQVVELLIRFWLIPFRLVYGASFYSSRTAIVGGVIVELASFVLCGCLIGYLMPTRAITAAIIGGSMFIGMNLTEAYTGSVNYANFTFLASMLRVEPETEGFEIYRLGIITGLVFRGIIVVLVARAVARRRIRKGLVYK